MKKPATKSIIHEKTPENEGKAENQIKNSKKIRKTRAPSAFRCNTRMWCRAGIMIKV
ncbi:MAG: hypothetical protein WC593_08845 [Methanoregula sp.]